MNRSKPGVSFVMMFFAALMLVVGGTSAKAEELIKLDSCWMPSTEAFVPWYAKKMGWDKEEGLDLQMHFFDSGPAQMEAIPAKAWVVGSTGGVGQIIGALRYEAQLIGISYMDAVPRPSWSVLTAQS